MELFNEVKNCYYTCMQNIVNQIIIDGVEFNSKRIMKCFSENAFNIEECKSSKIGDNFLSELFKESDSIKSVALLKEFDGCFEPAINEPVPVMLTKIEMRYLKTLLHDSGFCNLLEKKLCKKLNDNLSKVESFKWQKNCVLQGVKNYADNLSDYEMAEKIKIIIKAIVEEKSLFYTNRAKDGTEYVNKTGIPYRILYSPRTGIFQLIIVSDKKDRPILLNIQNMTCLKVGVICKGIHKLVAELIEQKKKQDEPLVLEVKDIFGSVERCFSLFSYYHKEAYYDETARKHILKIHYYDFDKSELIRDILSLGDAVLVRSPEGIRKQVIDRIKKAYFV